MAQVELVMPKMGESIIEATILNWVKKEGDTVSVDETILEIATDKVDSEIPSPVDGTILKTFFNENDVVEIGKVIAIIGTEGETSVAASPAVAETPVEAAPAPQAPEPKPEPKPASSPAPAPQPAAAAPVSSEGRFYSPLVRNIAAKEGIGQEELDRIPGTGKNGRVTKKDILAYVNNGRSAAPVAPAPQPAVSAAAPTPTAPSAPAPSPSPAPSPAPANVSGNVEIIEMDRMRKMIADHMVRSKHTSPHVTSFVEVDVTNLVNWRNGIKAEYQKKYGEKITFTPLFIEACVQALKEYPMVNVSVDGDRIIKKNDINIGMAAALPSGNLIVPVIHNADHLNLVGLTARVNDLANRARSNKLKPEEIQGGTFTMTNVGTFGNAMGTPIINQPQVAIMATGSIKKKPAVLETEHGDVIAIRHMMFLSLSYDHRVVDGALGGSYLRKVGDILEGFDPNRTI
jgi:2-oxoglutarate dehydrogenase E2 component (dihydrolipoamide succinyltransferase)